MGYKSRTNRSERGAALLELVVSLMVLVVLAAGMLEYGNLFGNTIDVSAAVRDAARAGAASSEKVQSDKSIVASLRNRSGLKTSQISKVVIYKADTTGKPPAACLEMFPPPAGSRCNVYRTEDLEAAELFSTPGALGWPVSQRIAGTDYLGVFVQLQNSSLIDLVWTPPQFSDNASMLIEPINERQNGQTLSGFTTGNAPHEFILDEDSFYNWGGGTSDDGNTKVPSDGKGSSS